MRFFVATFAPLLLACACTLPGDASDRSPLLAGSTPARASSVIDSVLPPAEEMQRFRADGGPTREALAGGARSRDSLVGEFLRALQQHDTSTVRALVMDRVEFADLYYPHSRFIRPPYRTPVGFLWARIQLNSEKGIVRALRRFGGQPISLVDVTCATPIEALGPFRLHNRCVTRYVTAAGDTASRRLFGAIVEVRGRFKFVSYANDM